MVIGAGAIGGAIAAALVRGGVPAVLVARGRNAEVLWADGLTLRTPDGTFVTPIDTVADPDGIRLTERDVLVFATKTQQLDAALQQWVDRPVYTSDGRLATAGESLPVLMALNGVSAEELAQRYFRRVFGVCVWCPAVHLNPGEVIVRLWPVVAQFHVGRWPADLSNAADVRFLEDLATVWNAAGMDVRVTDNVARWKYNKLLLNLANVVSALATEEADVSAVCEAVLAEGEEVLRQADIDFVPFETADAVRSTGPAPRAVPGWAAARSDSTTQSLARNTGSVETDYLNGEIVRLAFRHGTSAPMNAALTRAARVAAREDRGPGGYSATQLAELIALKTDG